MHVAKNLPIVFLMLLAGCGEQPPVAFDAPVPIVKIVAEDSPGLGVDLIGPRNETDLIEVVELVAVQTLFKVIKVVDGDTIDVLTDDKETIRLRFNGIDTPERGQPFGNDATKFVSDTVGGKVIPFQEDYDYWMDLLKCRLQNITRWRETDDKRNVDRKEAKFGDPQQILEYLNRLTDEQEACFNLLNDRAVLKGQIGFLNLFHSTQEDVVDTCKPFDSDWFADIQNFLMNSVPEKSGCAGMVVFEGQNAEGENCFFIKLRRAVKFSGIDLRTAEGKLKELFGDLYMGGGGHAGAASFRIHPLDEKEFLEKIEKVFDFFNAGQLASSDN